MRIMHTADWHLGRIFHHHSLLPDQEKLLQQVLEHVASYSPDLFILGGDIFDRVNPPKEAVDLFSNFLRKLLALSDCRVVLIAGNHDAGELIDFSGVLRDSERVLVAGTLAQNKGHILTFNKEGKAYAVSALPFTDISSARHYYSRPMAGFHDVLAAQLDEAAAFVPENHEWLVVAHCFAQGGQVSESERSLLPVGGLDTVDTSLFQKTAYTALGHLHRSQRVDGQHHIRYSGSLMPYGFDEVDQEKSVLLVDLPKEGCLGEMTELEASAYVRKLPLNAGRKLTIVEGLFDDLVQSRDKIDDLVKVNLQDKTTIPDATNRLRAVFPNILLLEYVSRTGNPVQSEAQGRRLSKSHPDILFGRFFEDVTGEALAAEEKQQVTSTLKSVIEENS